MTRYDAQIITRLCSVLIGVISILTPTWIHAKPIQSITLNQEVLSAFERVQVHVPVDPFYRKGMLVAEGVRFDDVLSSQLSDTIKSNPKQYLLRFVCSDGYMTIYPFSSIKGGAGIIADRLISLAPQEGGAPQAYLHSKAKPWPMRQRDQAEDHPGPYYILWEGERFSKHRPWPYQLTSIDILPTRHLSALKPDPADGVDAGYKLFATHCKACHAMNLVGGVMGPELNVPQNITNYRTRAQLAAFIKNPKSFRFSSLMPPSALSTQEIELVLDYLKAMSKRQVCQTIETCQQLVHP